MISEKAFSFTVRRGSLYLQEDGTLGRTPYTFSLTNGQAKEFAGVPAGVYTVTEENGFVEGYIWEVADGTRSGAGSDISYSKSMTIADENASAEAAFDNLYTKIENGSLTVTKNVTGGPAEAADHEYMFEITTTRHGETLWLDADGNLTDTQTKIGIRAGQPLVLDPVPAGTYTVTEDTDDAAFDEYSLDVTYEYTENTDTAAPQQAESVTVHKDRSAAAVVTNAYTYLFTPVKITKTVTGNMGNKNLFFGFEIYLRDEEDQPIVLENVTNADGRILENISLKDGRKSCSGSCRRARK